MNSKEALKYVREELKTQWADDCYCLEEDALRVVEAIEKDLDMLDVFRNCFYIDEKNLFLLMSEERKQKIMRWLNDK